jgi:GDP-mannose 6-dehydrogenase
MKVAILGLGYVGFTAACCIAQDGHEVVGVDVSKAKVASIMAGRAPFEEPGLQAMMDSVFLPRNNRATTSLAEGIADADIAVVCVGTPSLPDGAHDMRYIVDVSRQIAAEVARTGRETALVVAYRSTMRPGSTRRLIGRIFEDALGDDWERKVELVYNPEFLREAQAIHDYYHPPKIVIGTRDGRPNARMEALHLGIDAPVFVTGYEEAEITKFVDNSWHATKVAFANEIGRICQRMDISAAKVHEIFVSDTKLNISANYTRPGGAFGGSCLPKDVRALQNIAAEVGISAPLVDSLLRTNEAHKNHQFDMITRMLPEGGRVLMAGLAFKAGSDDLRESPNVDIARRLLDAGYVLGVFDPHLEPSKLRGQNLGYLYSALPVVDRLLVNKAEAEAADWHLVVASNATANALCIQGVPVLAISEMTRENPGTARKMSKLGSRPVRAKRKLPNFALERDPDQVSA